jgi:hypothetical protein
MSWSPGVHQHCGIVPVAPLGTARHGTPAAAGRRLISLLSRSIIRPSGSGNPLWVNVQRSRRWRWSVRACANRGGQLVGPAAGLRVGLQGLDVGDLIGEDIPEFGCGDVVVAAPQRLRRSFGRSMIHANHTGPALEATLLALAKEFDRTRPSAAASLGECPRRARRAEHLIRRHRADRHTRRGRLLPERRNPALRPAATAAT